MYSSSYEDDLLFLRLETLNPIVDFFVVLESRFSHSKLYKGLQFNIEKFDKFKDKIIYYNQDFIDSDNLHLNEQAARNSLLIKADEFCKGEDIILNSDLDEIGNPEVIESLIKQGIGNKLYTLYGDYFIFCMDLYGRKDFGGTIIRRDTIGNTPLSTFRSLRTNWHKDHPNLFTIIPNSHHHYSSCYSLKGIVNKFLSYCHADECVDYVKNEDYIKEIIQKRRGGIIKTAPDGDLIVTEMKYPNCPKFLEKNIDKYKQYLYSNYI